MSGFTVEARKFYVRTPEPAAPGSHIFYEAVCGFRALGVEVSFFDWTDEITEVVPPPEPGPLNGIDDTIYRAAQKRASKRFADLAPDVGIAGYIGDIWAGLARAGKQRPEPIDYPPELTALDGRRIYPATLDDVRRSIKPLFVKPREHKLFTGFVYNGDADSRLRIAQHLDSTVVWISEVVDFVSEYRVFLLRGKIVDVRRYKGDWFRSPNPHFIEEASRLWRSMPAACCLDVGVGRDGRTLVVEANDGLAFGTYGLDSTLYARMLAARWSELMRSASDAPETAPAPPGCTCFVDDRRDLEIGEWLAPVDNPCPHHPNARRVKSVTP